ncbi:MAG: hypothetical protein LGL72_12810 [Acidibrevibacterium sp.]|jgi:hypothetical protein|uniref:hypothetical protein n=1 Tax=Acidibrevibacterium fodinaquatile TaxID=1969806 RepID=UPI000E0D595E|nr:hypothetical protein [Acidibrevibacterium fodinaquatile]MCA7120260.1 hypothetical protein [Acidibrevibacterium fodinaquatile]
MGLDSGNSLTALYHERWPMTGRKPGTIFVPTILEIFSPHVLLPPIAITVGTAEPAAPCPHKAGTAPRLGADGKAADLGKHENGNAELRPEVKALTLLSWKGTATSLTGLRHHGWPG